MSNAFTLIKKLKK